MHRLYVAPQFVRHGLLLVFGLLVASSASAQTVYHVIYLGGQSNMEGYGYYGRLPDDLKGEVEGVRIFHGQTGADNAAPAGYGIWTTLKPGHGNGFSTDGTSNAYTNRFGPELSFGVRLKQIFPALHIALIKYERGGSSIDSLAAGRFGSWDPDFVGENGVNQFDHFLATVQNAMAVKDIDGDGREDTLIPTGILWMQGESDAAYSTEIANRYEENLRRLMHLMRAAFESEDLPVIIGRISDSGIDPDGKVWDFFHLVRQAQESYVESEERAVLLTATDGYGYSDPWHYDSAGYIDLGHRFADAIAPFINP